MRQPSLHPLFRFAFTPIAIAIAGLAPVTAALAAEEAAGDEERVQVVGSRMALRSEKESAVPVDLISGDELRNSGVADVGAALELLAPSFNFAEMSITDGSDHVKPAMLRGLGPDQTLVLVNGKRRHQSALIHVYTVGRGTAGTDLNAIPMAAVERIEVLRDGASAQYGSDAIAGVINIVLKDDLGVSISEQLSTTEAGDGDTSHTSLNAGFGIGEGYVNVSAEYKKADAFNRALPDQYGGQWRLGEPDLEQSALFFNAELPLGGVDIYAFGGYSLREGEAGAYFRCPQAQADAGSWYCSPIPPEQLPVAPNGFLPFITSEVEDTSIAVGARFDIGDWQADMSVVDGENTFGFGVNNSLNKSWGLGPTGNAADVPRSAHAGDMIFRQTTFNFDLSGAVHIGQQEFNLAFGASMRQEGFEITAGDEYSWANYGAESWGLPDQPSGIQGFPGWSPNEATDLSRDSYALYAEASTQLTDALRVEAAVRHEDYEDFGTDLSTKLAAFWQLSEQVSLRGSINDGFRAPSLQQIGFTQLSSTFEGGANVIVGTFNIDSDVAQAFEIPDLEAEDSLSYTVGLVAEPATGWEITVDLYNIEISDRIGISGRFSRGDDPLIDSILPTGVDAASFFTNAIDTETNGIDLVIHYQHDVDTGHLEYTFAASHVVTEVTSVDDMPGLLAGSGLDDLYFTRRDRAIIEDYSPQDRFTLAATHVAEGWRFGASVNYFGEVWTRYDTTSADYDYLDKADWILNLNLGYDFGNGFTVAGAINNVEDKYPKPQHSDWNGEPLPYSLETAQWGLAGRVYTLQLGYTF